MNRAPQFTQSLADCEDPLLVGGKAMNLGRLVRAGFRVPSGFVVTTRAYRSATTKANKHSGAGQIPPAAVEEILLAYRTLGGGAVAVRSSATGEDTSSWSMAGQFDTFLNVQGEADLLNAIGRCWAGIAAPRILAYFHEYGIDSADVGMAVVIQRLVSAQVAGVLFTANPQRAGNREMLIEASWGLGEAVVSGQVQPDILRVDEATGKVLAATIGDKQFRITPGNSAPQRVADADRCRRCLGGVDVDRLWQLGRRVAEHFAAPQDIEWAFDAGELYILQSRPITTLKNTDTIQHILDSVRGDLRVKTAQARGPWVMHNLAETLPHPTPLTWSVIQRFMSGAGALGAMYRLAGFNPAAAVNQDGFLVRIAGRLYMDTAIAPEMFFDNFPFRYDVEELKRRPDAAQAPPTRLSGSAIARWRAAKRMAAANKQLHRLAETFDQELREAHFPAMRRYVESAQRTELISLTAEQIISLWQQHEQEVLLHFGAYSLLPSLICAMALAELTEFLREHFWDQDAVSLAQHISAGGNINSTLDADAELQEVAAGTRTLDEWIEKHGHRAAGEFDLATPRWRENLQAAREMAAQLADRESTLVRHARISEEIALQVAQLQQKLPRSGRPKFAALLDRARRYLGFREDAKDALMLGYDLLRRLALDAGRRLEIGDDVFYLSREDLFEALRIGYAPFHLIAQQKREYEIEGCIELPFLIDASAIDLIGEPATVESTEAELAALSISPGHATGPAQILRRPSDAGALKPGYVLVAPSTDPAWTPLFINAAAIVLECGGVLSHGAIVARELGIPAVVLPNATKRFQSGEHIYVDGSRGVVNCVAQRAAPVDPVAPRNTDTRIPCPCVPPPPGSKDRQAARLRNGFGLAWTVFLVGFFLLPETWVRRPALFLFDTMLWPMVRAWGKPAAVMVVAAAMALLTMMIQKFVTDNRRLREAKRRAKQLEAQAALVPAESPRRRAMLDCCAPLPARTLAAAMAPIGILLGPIVISFVWLGERMAPAAWNVPPNSAVQVVATIDGDWSQPVQISPPANFVVDEATPPVRTLPPLRKTLEHVLQLYHHSAAPAGAPWELDAVPNLDREQIVTDLQSYLASKMPDQGITWLLRPTGGVSGRMPIELTTPGQPALTIEMVLGDENPPVPTRIFGPSIGPIKAIHLVYAKPRVGQFFWQPFASLAKFSNVPFAANLSVLEPNWLWLYLLVYIPTMLVARRGLGVA